MDPASREGLVLRLDAKVCHVEVEGQRLIVPLAGRLFEHRSHQKQPLAVGDRVRVRVIDGGAIDAVLPRQSQLCRRSLSAGGERAQVVAANVTLVLVVAAIAEPPFQPELVDGLLAAARREDIQAAVVITKQDRDLARASPAWAKLYRDIGYRAFVVSTAAGHVTTAPLAELALLLAQNRTVLSGLSGVGKSTLLNALAPGLQLRTGTLNHIDQGRHVTTHTELLPLPGGGHVLDTPGVRAFHLFQVGSQEMQFLFPEIGALLPHCQYRNCLHRDEPGCAVSAAAARGEVAPTRYDSYLRMLTTAAAAEKEEKVGTGRTSGDGAGGHPRRRRPRR